ncbi:hypothetical protein [Lapidilactobacillus gannanensis]|uniref:Uncharacterized protein n=1 Tax=Lapidilactobacillus gannanensis TaxID=2486002 RepID=A0ABW4BK48_9LACO|nr:hypothetical protein [Lapidilactobacillus gannanensis]
MEQDDLPIDWDEQTIYPGQKYWAIHEYGNKYSILVRDDPDEILDWLDTTEYDYDKPAFIERYCELDTSSVIDDILEGWFIKKDKDASDVEFFRLYVCKELHENQED